MTENEIGEVILGCALGKAGLAYKRQLVLPVIYDTVRIDAGYRIDLLVNDLVVIEAKAIDRLLDIHRAQVLSYLKLGGYKLGYLLNFNVTNDGRHLPFGERPMILPPLRSSASSAVNHV